MTERWYLIPIALLVAVGIFLLWKNWAKVAGTFGAGAGASGGGATGGGPSILAKAKALFIPPVSFDPRKGSIANPAGYVYAPVKNVATSVWHAVTPW